MARVILNNVSKTFPLAKGREIVAVNNLNLTVEHRELIVLVGPSGSGKTTILRLIAGLEELTEGSITLDERRLDRVPSKEREIAMVFQNGALYPHMTVFDNLAFGLKLRKVANPEIIKRLQETAQLLEIQSLLDRLPSSLSGGERQRVALGRAMVRQPKVLLLDEPLSNLDAPLRGQLRREIARLHAHLAATLIYVTHDQVEAMTLGDRVAVLHQGCLQQIGDPIALYHRPANLFVAGFLGSPPMNFLRGTLEHNQSAFWFLESAGAVDRPPIRLPLDSQNIPEPKRYLGKRLILGLRPEAIVAAPVLARETQAPIAGRVALIESLGPENYLHLDTGGGSPLVARVPPATRARVDQPITIYADMRQAHFFDPPTEQAIRTG